MFSEVVETYRKAYTDGDSILQGDEREFGATPERVMRMFKETFALGEVPKKETAKRILLAGVTTCVGSCDTVTVKGIHVTGLCPHHLLPVLYNIEFSYSPASVLVGLSKVPRFLTWLARFPMLQERFGDVAVALFDTIVSPARTFMDVKGRHMCVSRRGVRMEKAVVLTSHQTGS